MEDAIRLLLYNIIKIELEKYKGYKELEKLYMLFDNRCSNVMLIREVKNVKWEISIIEKFLKNICGIDINFILSFQSIGEKNLKKSEYYNYKLEEKIIWDFIKKMEIKKVCNIIKIYFEK